MTKVLRIECKDGHGLYAGYRGESYPESPFEVKGECENCSWISRSAAIEVGNNPTVFDEGHNIYPDERCGFANYQQMIEWFGPVWDNLAKGGSYVSIYEAEFVRETPSQVVFTPVNRLTSSRIVARISL